MFWEVVAGPCRLALRDGNGDFLGWTARNYSVEKAQDSYQDTEMWLDGTYVSGYCCATCPY